MKGNDEMSWICFKNQQGECRDEGRWTVSWQPWAGRWVHGGSCTSYSLYVYVFENFHKKKFKEKKGKVCDILPESPTWPGAMWPWAALLASQGQTAGLFRATPIWARDKDCSRKGHGASSQGERQHCESCLLYAVHLSTTLLMRLVTAQ